MVRPARNSNAKLSKTQTVILFGKFILVKEFKTFELYFSRIALDLVR